MSLINQLPLHEEVLLLALKDDEGTIASGTMYHYAISAALMTELIMNKSVRIVEEKKKNFVELNEKSSLKDDLLIECIEKISNAKRRATLQTWISRFSGIKKLKQRTAESLCKKNILKMDEDKVLLIFNRTIYPEINPVPEKKIISRLEKAIFTDSENIDPRTVVLLSLANASGLLRANFDKKELKKRKDRIEQVIIGEMMGKATAEVIQAVQSAIMIAAIMPAITAATVSGS